MPTPTSKVALRLMVLGLEFAVLIAPADTASISLVSTSFRDKYGDQVGMVYEGGHVMIKCKGTACDEAKKDKYKVVGVDGKVVAEANCNATTLEVEIRVDVDEKLGFGEYVCQHQIDHSDRLKLSYRICDTKSDACIKSDQSCQHPKFCIKTQTSTNSCTTAYEMANSMTCTSESKWHFCGSQSAGAYRTHASLCEISLWNEYKYATATYSGADCQTNPPSDSANWNPAELEINGRQVLFNAPAAVTTMERLMTVKCPAGSSAYRKSLVCNIGQVGGAIIDSLPVITCDKAVTVNMSDRVFEHGSQVFKLGCGFYEDANRNDTDPVARLSAYLVVFAGELVVSGNAKIGKNGDDVFAGPVNCSLQPREASDFSVLYEWKYPEKKWTMEGSTLDPPFAGNYTVMATVSYKTCSPHLFNQVVHIGHVMLDLAGSGTKCIEMAELIGVLIFITLMSGRV